MEKGVCSNCGGELQDIKGDVYTRPYPQVPISRDGKHDVLGSAVMLQNIGDTVAIINEHWKLFPGQSVTFSNANRDKICWTMEVNFIETNENKNNCIQWLIHDYTKEQIKETKNCS